MNTLKQSFKFCSFLRKRILYKLYLVASTNSFILFQMPAIVWCCMNVHVKIFLFKHRHSKTQQWKHLNCWFYLKKKNPGNSPFLYDVSTLIKLHTSHWKKKSIFHSLFVEESVHLPEVSVQFRQGQFALCTNQLFTAFKNWASIGWVTRHRRFKDQLLGPN